MSQSLLNAEQFKHALTANHGGRCWPGLYPVYFITSDGEALSWDAAKKKEALICEAIDSKSNCGWRVVAAEINYEDPALFCCHSNQRIPSAYAEDESK